MYDFDIDAPAPCASPPPTHPADPRVEVEEDKGSLARVASCSPRTTARKFSAQASA